MAWKKSKGGSAYLFIVGRIKVLEKRLLDRSLANWMAEAGSVSDLLRIVGDTEYGVHFAALGSHYDYEAALSAELKKVYKMLEADSPEKELTTIFRLRYDYHNLKALLKEKYSGRSADRALSILGEIDIEALRSGLQEDGLAGLPGDMREAALKAAAAYGKEKDPQAIDIEVDRYMYEVLGKRVAAYGNGFLTDIFQAWVDLTNLSTFLRVVSQGRDRAFLGYVLLPGGKIVPEAFIKAFGESMEALSSLLAATPYSGVASQGIEAWQGSGDLSRLEKLSEDYVIAYAKRAKQMTFGPEPLIGYIVAKENDAKIIRTAMVGKINDLPAVMIAERLRDAYI
jgi:V/A-type H+-transporting ATPase subunit C